MLLKDLENGSIVQRNYVLVEYRFVDKAVQVSVKQASANTKPSIHSRVVIAKGRDVSDTIKVNDAVVLEPNMLEHVSIPVFFEDNSFDRQLVIKQIAPLIKADEKLNFKPVLVKAYALIPEASVVMTYKAKELIMEDYLNNPDKPSSIITLN